MRKIIICIFILFFSTCSFAQVSESCKSKVTSKSSLIFSGAGKFYGLRTVPDGFNDMIINVYDGKSITPIYLTPSNILIKGNDFAFCWPLSYYPPVNFIVGLYIDIQQNNGTGTVQVLYGK